MSLTLKEALATLGIKNIGENPPKMKFIQKRFYQLSLIHHPDRPGGDTATQQKINEAFQFIGDYILHNYVNIDDSEEDAARQVFNNFNFTNIKENLLSFTINIDNNLSHLWETILTKHYGPPADRKTNGKHWKHHNYTDDDSNCGDITIGKWHIPKKDKQSKINIQANTQCNILPTHFVSFHYPKLLSEVKDLAAAKNITYDVPSLSLYKCENCDFKAKSKSVLETHRKKWHKNVPAILASTTAKRSSKFVIHPPLNVLPSTPVTLKCEVCESIFYKEEYLKEHMISIHKGSNIIPQHKQCTPTKDVPCVLCGKAFSSPSAATNHIQTEHEIICANCGDVFYDKYDLNLHILSNHNRGGSSMITHSPDHSAEQIDRLSHMLILEAMANSIDEQELTVEYCNLAPTTKDGINNHPPPLHEETTVPKSFECDHCPLTLPSHRSLNDHVSSYHTRFNCDLCDLVTTSQNELIQHKEQVHTSLGSSVHPNYSCALCGISFSLSDDLEAHIQRRHVFPPDSPAERSEHHCLPNAYQNHTQARLLEEQVDMALSLKHFQDTTIAQLSEIRETQEVFKESLKTILENFASTHSIMSDNLAKLQTNIDKLSTTITSSTSSPPPPVSVPPRSFCPSTNEGDNTSIQSLENPTITNSTSKKSIDSSHSTSPSCYPTPHPPSNTYNPSSSSSHSTLPPSRISPSYPTTTRTSPPQHMKSQSNGNASLSVKASRLPTSRRPKVLFLADSIGSNADIRHLEEATNTLIYVEKAFGAAYKADAQRPNNNFMHAAMNAPTKREYSYAILQGSCTDITNLDIKSVDKNYEFFKQEVAIASKNMISAARTILLRNPEVKKVLILDRIPRFDIDDPFQVKNELSEYGNAVFRQELDKSDHKDRIFLASHSLPNVFQENLYGHPSDYNVDGIHLNGPDGRNFYTRSLCNILQTFFHEFSRESHNHLIPNTKSSNQNITSLHSSSSSTTSSKPSFVVIDIPDAIPTYTIPTHNMFNILGN